MKRNIKFSIFGWFAVAAMLLTTSCKDDSLDDGALVAGEYETISFSVSPEASPVRTRAVEYPGSDKKYSRISDGTKADMLIYAVYDQDGNLLPEYGQGKDSSLPDYIVAGEGQTIMAADKFPVEIKLQVKRDHTYKVAFWAQSSKCKAYATYDLTQVQMLYEEREGSDSKSTPNNDELRDAFCRVESITVDRKATETRYIYLYRPLAQINVGTTGYDYEIVVRDDNSKYAYTRTQIITAARYLNVVEDKIYTDNETNLRSALDYTYARIPAYMHYTDEEFASVDITRVEDAEREEFLYVDLNGDKEFKGYLSEAPAEPAEDGVDTETFKYLSMSYVLVASDTKMNSKGETTYTYEPTTIDHVNVWIATDPDGKDEVQIVQLVNVPAQRNYRTNIVGNILTDEITFNVTVDPIYSGDHNGRYEGDDEVDWSGPLADGAYYDAVADEILISNINGLLWLQKMVNGKLVYRECNSAYNVVGKPYVDYYYDASGVSRKFSEFSNDYYVEKPDDAELLNRIMKATHQNTNPNSSGWPANGNFHFMGIKNKKADPAKVKLMADIDLSGIDWLPIGYDCLIYDNSMRNHFDATRNIIVSDEKGETTGAGSRRAFCGIFDGNGHTISNVRNMKFNSEVVAEACQNNSYGPYDNPQWFPAGLFGMVGGDARILNLRVSNVDFFGCHTGGGIVGTVNGDNVIIDNCTVDGGQIIMSPMYRGDIHNLPNKGRTFARGIYVGGIAGFYNASGSVTNCTVRNVEMRAYRNIGGIVGTEGSAETVTNNYPKSPKPRISGNTVNNVVIIADKFQPYDFYYSIVGKNGYGWNQKQLAYSNDFVGGTSEETYNSNTAIGVIRTEFSTRIESDASTERIAEITDIPLNHLPMLSSWFCDNLTLRANFSGTTSAYKRYNVHEHDIQHNADKTLVTGSYKIFPFRLPTDLSVDFDTASGNVGMYVESVVLEGKQDEEHPYSVLTVNDATGSDDCAMFITSRDITPFVDQMSTQSTTVNNMIVRGIPYAYTGVSLAPNRFTGSITLNNVSVYDVYQTIALDRAETGAGVWPGKSDPSGATLVVNDSNLRGYTVPGSGWKSIGYNNVVFERGASVMENGNENICKVEASAEGTTFTGCTFKAPFVVEIASGADVEFSGCKAVYGDSETDIELPEQGCTKIIVNSDGTVDYE